MARAEYEDVVLSPQGKPVPYSTVSIKVHPGSAGSNSLYVAEAGAATYTSLQTNRSGVFNVWLEEGRYDVTAVGKTSTVDVINQASVAVGSIGVEAIKAENLAASAVETAKIKEKAVTKEKLSAALIVELEEKSPAGYPVANIKTYGAKVDGSTDDTTAIKAAVKALEEAGGGTLFFPAGTCITTGFVWPSKVQIKGAGINTSIIKLKKETARLVGTTGDVITSKEFATLAAAGAGGSGPGTSLAGINSCSMEDITLDGNKSEQAAGKGGCGLRVFGYGYQINRVTMRNCKLRPLVSEWGSGGGEENDSMESIISNCKFHESEEGVYYNGPHDSAFSFCHSYGHKSGAVGFEVGKKAPGLELLNCHPWAFNAKPLAAGLIAESSGMKVIGGQYEGHYTGGVGIMLLANEITVSGVYIYTTGEGKTTGRGIQFGSDSKGVSIGGAKVDVLIDHCTEGPLDFQTKRVGLSSIRAVCYCPGKPAFIGSASATNIFDVLNTGEGEASTGNIFKPVPYYSQPSGGGKGAQISVSHKAGAAEDGDFPIEVLDGTMQVNTTSNLFEFRSGGSWHAPGLPGFEEIVATMLKGESVTNPKIKASAVTPEKALLAAKPAAAGEGLTTEGESGVTRTKNFCINGNAAKTNWPLVHNIGTHQVQVTVMTSSAELASEVVAPTKVVAVTNAEVQVTIEPALGAGTRRWITVVG